MRGQRLRPHDDLEEERRHICAVYHEFASVTAFNGERPLLPLRLGAWLLRQSAAVVVPEMYVGVCSSSHSLRPGLARTTVAAMLHSMTLRGVLSFRFVGYTQAYSPVEELGVRQRALAPFPDGDPILRRHPNFLETN